MRVILLAAGVGKRFGSRTQTIPKCLIPIDLKKKTLLSRYFDSFEKLGIRDVTIVVGHKRELIKKFCQKYSKIFRIRFLVNARYRLGSVVSLYTARQILKKGALVMDADVFFPTEALEKLLVTKQPTAFLVDPRSQSTGEEMMLMAKNGRPFGISKQVEASLKILGESIGFLKVGASDGALLVKILGVLVRQGHTRVEYEEAYNILMKKRKIGVVGIGNIFWREMDFEEDLEKITDYLRKSGNRDIRKSGSGRS